WASFGKCRDVAFVGRDAIATVSGVYARFFDWITGETRIERFEGRERGDGASCVAGLSIAPIFSLVERKSNPRILIFVYPSIRRIARCARSEEANGYACCAFAGTEYLLGQTIFPDFRIVVWHWKTGEWMTTIDVTMMSHDHLILTCSPDSPLLVARHSPNNRPTVSIYRLLICSKIVRLFPVETNTISDLEPVSLSWSTGGTLLVCDRLGNVSTVELDLDETREQRVRRIIESLVRPRRKPVLVAHRGGAMLVVAPSDETNAEIRATFFKKRTTDREENWRPIWTISLSSYPNRMVSHPRDDKIVLLAENGEMYAIIGPSRDCVPRFELITRWDNDYAMIARLPGSYLGALSRPTGRLVIVDTATGNVVSPMNRLLLKHHGKVTRLVSHPSLPILATCSVAGNCVIVEASTPSSPRIVNCVHLQREPLDRLKFSEGGRLLGVGASRLGRLFLL
ncbi:hypothetical protein WN55_02449, partial [Dufourea novaeangliae]